MRQIVVQVGSSPFWGQLQRFEPLNNWFHHIVFEMGGIDQILGIVMLDLGFGVSNCSSSVLVAFLRSVAKDWTIEQRILSHFFRDGGCSVLWFWHAVAPPSYSLRQVRLSKCQSSWTRWTKSSRESPSLGLCATVFITVCMIVMVLLYSVWARIKGYKTDYCSYTDTVFGRLAGTLHGGSTQPSEHPEGP